MDRTITWGILSAGRISHDFTASILHLPSNEHQVVAVGARKLQDAQLFAEKFNIPQAHGSYEDLAKDPKVEIVYIGTIHPFHLETTKLMLNHGKHVLCEKPLAMNFKEVKEMTDLAKEKGLFLMEGLWSRFFPVYDHIRENLKNGPLQSAQYLAINAGIDFFGGKSHGAATARVTENSNGGGALMTMGVYGIQLALLLFNEEPTKIKATGITVQPNNVDKFTSLTLYFTGDRMAQINFHLGAAMENSALISCADLKEVVKVPMFIAPKKITISGKTYEYPTPESKMKLNYGEIGFIYEIKAARESLLKGETENIIIPHSESLRMAKIID